MSLLHGMDSNWTVSNKLPKSYLNQSQVYYQWPFWQIYFPVVCCLHPCVFTDAWLTAFTLHFSYSSHVSLDSSETHLFNSDSHRKQRETKLLSLHGAVQAGKQTDSGSQSGGLPTHTLRHVDTDPCTWASQEDKARKEEKNSIYSQLTQQQPKATSSHQSCACFFFTYKSAEKWGCLAFFLCLFLNI